MSNVSILEINVRNLDKLSSGMESYHIQLRVKGRNQEAIKEQFLGYFIIQKIEYNQYIEYTCNRVRSIMLRKDKGDGKAQHAQLLVQISLCIVFAHSKCIYSSLTI